MAKNLSLNISQQKSPEAGGAPQFAVDDQKLGKLEKEIKQKDGKIKLIETELEVLKV